MGTHGSPKSKLQNPNPQNQNSKIQNQNSKIQNQNSKIQTPKNQNSKIQSPKIKTPKSKIKTTKSKLTSIFGSWPVPQKKIDKYFLGKSSAQWAKYQNGNHQKKLAIDFFP